MHKYCALHASQSKKIVQSTHLTKQTHQSVTLLEKTDATIKRHSLCLRRIKPIHKMRRDDL